MLTFAVFFAVACLLSPLEAGVARRQTEECPDRCKGVPMDISFVVDASASINPANFTTGLWFIQNFVDRFDIGPDKVRVSLTTYSHLVHGEHSFGFDQYTTKTKLDSAIDTIPYSGGHRTETGMGIRYYMENQFPHAREGLRRVLIVLTDGNSQEPIKTREEAEKAVEAGVEVFAIGVGDRISEEELHSIASDGRHVFRVASYQMLDDIMLRLAYETCGLMPEPNCVLDPVDIMLVIDSSVSIGEDNFTLGLEFIKEFLEVFEINPSSVRVAAIMFSNKVHADLVLPFDKYPRKKQTLDAIMALQWMHGSATETGAGIDYMVDSFVPHLRPHAAHIGIVITDGKSQKTLVTAASAKTARDAGITMYAVGVGRIDRQLDEKELDDIAGSPDRVLTADNYATLNLIKADLTSLACTGIGLALEGKAEKFL